MTLVSNSYKLDEEAKRDRNWDALARWKTIQQTIAWAEQQPTARRNTREACLLNQARILASRMEPTGNI